MKTEATTTTRKPRRSVPAAATTKTTTRRKGLAQRVAEAVAADVKGTQLAANLEDRYAAILKCAKKLADKGEHANAANIAKCLGAEPDAIASYLKALTSAGRMLSQDVDGYGKCYLPQDAPAAEKPKAGKATKPAATQKPAKAAKAEKASAPGERRLFITKTFYLQTSTIGPEPVKAALTRNAKELGSGNWAAWLTPAEETLLLAHLRETAGKSEPRVGAARTAHALAEELAARMKK